MSYKQFIQELEDDILPAEAERRFVGKHLPCLVNRASFLYWIAYVLPASPTSRYQEYRSEYISTQKRAYFDAHKDEEW